MKFTFTMFLIVFSMQAALARECVIAEKGIRRAVVGGSGSAGANCVKNVCAVTAIFSQSMTGAEVIILEDVDPFTAIGNEEAKIIGKLYYRWPEQQLKKFDVGDFSVYCE